ncbi:hypothetical protein ABOM_000962 [Aspergillus bombycis]|uniref:4-coumarate-CoA ligase n=1 Tax=Aspergillus bombycis TaxID=109264 RepID=A0A1F8AGQ3_9EURO|nr:hypothetical protein ABOM_000962 [Aspergillus bombycis]OGM50525.1 hypothetical protein ABOM_000962 [Aspergillus bombycis]
MPHQSRWSVDIPRISLPSFVFGGPNATLSGELAFVDTEKPDSLFLTFAEYFLWAKRFAAGLQQAGLKPQDRVIVFSGNNIFWPVAVMGVIMAGGIVTGANPTFTARELIYQLKDTGARYVLATPTSIQTAREAAQAVQLPLSNLFVFDDEHLHGDGKPAGDIKHWSQLIADRETGHAFSWKERSTPEELNETIILVYSSGTTGLPKGVEMSHATVISDLASKKALHAADPKYPFNEEQAKDYPVLCYLPMYHALGMVLFSIAVPARRQPVYVMKRYDLLKFMANIEKYRPFSLLLVPSIAVAMAKHPLIQSRKFDLSSVKRVEAGAAPLSRDICEEVERLWPAGNVNIKQTYGMTEAMMVCGWDQGEVSKTAAVGEPLPNCSIKLMDEDGNAEVAPGQRGEIWVKSPSLMKGYWRNPEATKNTFTHDKWLKTGDIAFRDEDGKYMIVDRKKELIKVKGNQVAPAELESVLLEHPDIQDAAVIEDHISNQDERPLAYVVKKPGARVSPNEILRFVEERVSKVKRITGGVVFIDAIPKNPTGKILRRVLRERSVKDRPVSARL